VSVTCNVTALRYAVTLQVSNHLNTNASYHSNHHLDYLSVTSAGFSLTYVTDSAEQSLLRRPHIKFALRSRVDEGCTENLRDHANETKAARESQEPMELAMPCLEYNLYCEISDTIRSLRFLSLSGLHLTKELKYRYAPHNDVSANDGPHIRRWSHKIIIL
jgi:hypothetical protein